MELNVSIQINGKDTLAGKLYQNVRHGTETAAFTYDEAYLRNPAAFALSPDMSLSSGRYLSSNGLKNLRAFEDCMPDRWGRNLMLRAERQRAKAESVTARTLFEADMLSGVNDKTRQGAIRIWGSEGNVLSDENNGVPREVTLPQLLRSADLIATDMEADVKDLLAAGSSLGGARPKASVQDEHGKLLIAKFPKANETKLDDVCAWEHVALRLQASAGIAVPASRLIRISNRSVLLLERFDRNGERRIPYISGLSAVQGTDGESYSYLELAAFIEEQGARPEHDLKELWRRILFSCAVGNTDNHMRNYGFLRESNGWGLSPAFDVNPTLGNETKYLSSPIDFERNDADPRIAMELCDYFRLSKADAKREAASMARALQSWNKLALADDINQASIKAMASCFESGIERLQALR